MNVMMGFEVSTKQLQEAWNKKSKVFTFEMSQFARPGVFPASVVMVFDKDRDVRRTFQQYKTDGDRDDLFGWRFVATDGSCELLIIND